MSIKTYNSTQVGRKDTGLFYDRASGLLSVQVKGVSRASWSQTGAQSLGEAVSNALVIGAGTSSARYAMGTTADKAMARFYGDALNTSGYARAVDARVYFGGVGGEGEAVRAYGIVNGVTVATGGTVNGLHASLDITAASSAVSGAGNAIRASLAIGAGLTPGVTLAGIQIDSQFGAAAVQGTGTAAIRVNNTGTEVWSKLLNLPAVASAGMVAAHTTQTMSHSIRIIAGATVLYLMCTDTVTNRTGGA